MSEIKTISDALEAIRKAKDSLDQVRDKMRERYNENSLDVHMPDIAAKVGLCDLYICDAEEILSKRGKDLVSSFVRENDGRARELK